MKAILTKAEQRQLIKENQEIFYPTEFSFLKEINGWRPGKFHLVIGNAGGGKSTLTRTLIADLVFSLKDKQKMLVYLSEETSYEFLSEFYRTKIESDKLMQVEVESEQEIDPSRDCLDYLEFLINETKPSVLFLDNLTTSRMYEGDPRHQSRVASKLKYLAKKHNFVLILVAHTGKHINSMSKTMITEQDIQGSSAPTKLAEFIFILQAFTCNNAITTTLQISKARGQQIKHKFYVLRYASIARIYAQSVAISFDELRKLYKERNYL